MTQLLTTIPVDFNHHSNRGGRVAFREWASTTPSDTFSAEPVFRYGRSFAESLAQLRTLAASQPDVFLCNIVGYSSVLTSRSTFDMTTDLAFSYDGMEALIDAPNVTGYFVDDDLLADALEPLRGWQVICGEYSFDDSSTEAGLTEVSLLPSASTNFNAEGTMHCCLTDPAQFASNWRNITFPTYFLPPSISLDFALVVERFRHERLSDYLLRKSISFVTMGECHMDDDIAVSCLTSAFKFPETLRCFIR
ncbi:MAG: hypothetical protein HKN47_04460 [Pirellulaceae bacterium]|nr:hypothetical protein [Pirellulaceae bacterium]